MNGAFFCEVELDDLCIYADNFVVDFFRYFGIKINFPKLSFILPQTIDFLGYSINARKCCFTLTQDKLFK